MKTLIKHVLSLRFLASLMVTHAALAAENSTVELPVEVDAIEEIRFKDVMENRLNRDIEAYLGNNRFIVYVDAKLKKTRTMANGGSANVGAPTGVSSQPALSAQPLPALDVGGRPDNTGEPKEILPGLPTSGASIVVTDDTEILALKQRVQQLDSELQQAVTYANNLRNNVQKPIDSKPDQLIGFRTEVEELIITVMLDEGLEDQQIEFIRNLVTRKASMDELRGDRLKVIWTEFNRSDKAAPLTWWQEYQNWLMLICFGLIFLLLMFAMYAFNRRLMDGLKDTSNASRGAFEPVVNNLSLDSGSSEKESNGSLSEIKQSLVTAGLGQPQVFQQLIATHLNSGNLTAVGSLYGLLGETLFRSLYPQLSLSDRETLVNYIQTEILDDQQKVRVLKELYNELLQTQGNAGSKKRPFEFLEKLNDSQILYLLKEEETRIKALILSQVSSQRAATLIHRLDATEQAAVAYEIGEFESLPVSTFRDVADRLAQKSLTVPSFKNISANGLAVLINMLDTMNGGEEAKLLKTLKADKPETYYRLRQVYYTFADLARTPELTISNELRDIDRTVMAQSLCHAPLDFKRYVLSGLPPKLRSSVIAELKAQELEVTQEQIEQAREQIVSRMRAVIKAGRFSMDDLIIMAQAG